MENVWCMAIEVRTLLDGQVIAWYRLLVPRAFQHPFTVRGWVLLKYDHMIFGNCCIDLECHFHFTLIFFPQRWEWCVWWQHLSWANSRSVSSGRICVNLLWPSLDSERRTHRGAGVLSRFRQQIYQEPCAIVQLKRWGEAYQP